MKKRLTAAITSALVIGVASTTFAAANPFSDVPTSHWSFDAVAKLAQDGVIEGYGDNTFRGDAHITRYEMAQMVAKAMAKSEDLSAEAKATVDKLAAEYAEELNNLGVRVANLEKKSDNVKITGLLRLDGSQTKLDGQDSKNSGTAMLRLNINAKVNEDWNVRGRIEAKGNLTDDENPEVSGHHVYAEGPLFGAKTKWGRFGEFDMNGFTNGGLLIDSKATGAAFDFGDKVKTKVVYGRLSDQVYKMKVGNADYLNLQVSGDVSDKLKLGAAYYNIRAKEGEPFDGNKTNGLWEVGFDYNFNPDLVFGALYAKSNVDGERVFDASAQSKAYSVQLTYKGAKSNVPQSYGVWLGYRQIGKLASFAPTYNGVGWGQKGYELGVEYMAAKNILTKIVYFDGKEISSDLDTSKIFGRVEFQF